MGTNVLNLNFKKKGHSSSFQSLMLSAHRWKSASDTFVCYSLLKQQSDYRKEGDYRTCGLAQSQALWRGKGLYTMILQTLYGIITAHLELMEDNGWRLIQFTSLPADLNKVNKANLWNLPAKSLWRTWKYYDHKVEGGEFQWVMSLVFNVQQDMRRL